MLDELIPLAVTTETHATEFTEVNNSEKIRCTTYGDGLVEW